MKKMTSLIIVLAASVSLFACGSIPSHLDFTTMNSNMAFATLNDMINNRPSAYVGTRVKVQGFYVHNNNVHVLVYECFDGCGAQNLVFAYAGALPPVNSIIIIEGVFSAPTAATASFHVNVTSLNNLTGANGGEDGDDEEDADVHIDLAAMNNANRLATINLMHFFPGTYVGKTIRAHGTYGGSFNNMHDIITVAGSCCASTLPFIYNNVPNLAFDTEIVIEGVFSSPMPGTTQHYINVTILTLELDQFMGAN
jgi:hypothetical protein